MKKGVRRRAGKEASHKLGTKDDLMKKGLRPFMMVSKNDTFSERNKDLMKEKTNLIPFGWELLEAADAVIC